MLKTIKCKACGASSFKKISEDVYQCKYCGTQAHKHDDETNMQQTETKNDDNKMFFDIEKFNGKEAKRKTFALIKLLLCIFVGYLGVHRFVEGKIISGIIYCFTYGLFGIGIIVDVVRFANQLSHIGREEE